MIAALLLAGVMTVLAGDILRIDGERIRLLITVALRPPCAVGG